MYSGAGIDGAIINSTVCLWVAAIGSWPGSTTFTVSTKWSSVFSPWQKQRFSSCHWSPAYNSGKLLSSAKKDNI